MDIQVDKSHYDFAAYITDGRWMSYLQQIREVANCEGKNILLIGAGDGIIANILRTQGYNIYQLDIDKELNPDFCGSVDNLDEVLGDRIFDIILCCQVLEHLPFESFERCIKQIVKHSTQAIVSLPYNHYAISNSYISIPLLRRKKIQILIPRFWKNFDIKRDGNGEHYWELGCKKRSCKCVLSIINSIRSVKRNYKYAAFPYHYFIVF